MNYLLFKLFKGLSLFRAPFKIVLFLGHLIERAYNLVVIWDVYLPKQACVSFLLVGRDVAAVLLTTSIGIW